MISIDNKTLLDGSVRWLDEMNAIRASVASVGYVDVSILIGGGVVYSDTLYSYDKRVEFDIRDILSEEYRLQGIVMGSVTVNIKQDSDSGSVSLWLVSRTGRFSALPEDFFTRSFLTVTSSKFMPLDGVDNVALIALPGNSTSTSVSIMYEDTDGNLQQKTVTGDGVGVAGSTPIFFSKRITWPLSQVPDGATLKAMTVQAGSRRMVYYPARDTNQVFRFRNIFNVEEYIYPRASVSSKVSTKASVGSVSSQLIRYDTETTEELTAQFSPMMPDEISELSQLADAEEPQWAQYDGKMPTSWETMIVESAEFTADPDTEELTAPKLTFRLKNKYPKLNLAGYGRIHTDQFTEPFN